MSTPAEQDQPTVTERDAIQREQEAFRAGWQAYFDTATKGNVYTEAKRRYPLPPRVRPRVVSDNIGLGPAEWRYVDGKLEGRLPNGGWRNMSTASADGMFNSTGMYITTARVKLLAELMANPTEPIPEDE